MDSEITFVRLTRDDLPMMHRWLNNPEVALFYGVGDDNRKNPTMEEVIEEYEPRLKPGAATHSFVTPLDGRPVGYIQCYRVGDYPDYAKELGEDPDAWAIDIFIGEDDARERNLGSRAIELLLEGQIFCRPGVTTCFICPDPDNRRAVGAYERAGFSYVKTVWIESEKAYQYVMRLDKRSET